jgi:hypothetical protein
MLSTSPHLSRLRVALLIASALTLVVAVLSSWTRAGALPAQRTTTRANATTTERAGPVTTDDPAPTRPRGPLTTAPTTRANGPQYTPPRLSTRRPASPSTAPGGGGRATTMPTLPGSTAVPELLVPGPNNTTTGAPPTTGDGMSAGTALRWVIIALVLVGLAIAGLTVAFWRHTQPKPPETEDDDGPLGGSNGTPMPGLTQVAHAGADPFAAPDPLGWSPAPGGPEPWDARPPPPSPSPSVGAGPAESHDSQWGSAERGA